MRKDAKIFLVLILVIGAVIFRFVIGPKLMQENKSNALKDLSESVVTGVDYLSHIEAIDYKDSLKFVYGIDQLYLSQVGSEVVRDTLDSLLIEPVCSLLLVKSSSPDYDINIVVRTEVGPIYDKYFSTKKCT